MFHAVHGDQPRCDTYASKSWPALSLLAFVGRHLAISHLQAVLTTRLQVSIPSVSLTTARCTWVGVVDQHDQRLIIGR